MTADTDRQWSKLYDSDLYQWQIIDGARVIATGIESEQDADRLLKGENHTCTQTPSNGGQSTK